MAKTEDPPQPSVRTVEDRIEELRKRRAALLDGSRKDAVRKQHEKGKLTARERVELLVDRDSFQETDPFAVHRSHDFGIERNRPAGDGVITGYGTVDGRRVFVASQDFTVFGGSLGEIHAQKICKVQDLAMSTGAPFIQINDSGGARIQEGAASLAGYGYVFERNVRASGVIPQISVIMGPCAGGAVYSPAITDFTFMVRETSHMFITGPDVIKAVTGEEVTFEELGGAMTHASRSGVASFVSQDEEECLAMVRHLLSYLPSNNLEDAPAFAPVDDPDRRDEGLTHVIPDSAREPYDMHEVIRRIVDDGDFFEVFPFWAMNVVTGSRGWTGGPSGSSRTSRRCSPGRSTSTRPRRPRGSCGRATRSTSRSSRSSTCRGSFRAPTRSTRGSSATAPSCCTRSPRRRCRGSP